MSAMIVNLNIMTVYLYVYRAIIFNFKSYLSRMCVHVCECVFVKCV